jgi:hypothetical protein
VCAVLVVGLLALAGCGSNDAPKPTTPKPAFRAGHINPAGLFYVSVSDAAEAGCATPWGTGPTDYPDQVTFDIPKAGADLTCIRSG